MPEPESHFRICFLPMGQTVEVASGTTIRDAALEGGIVIESICGGQASCMKCRVRILEGTLPEHGLDSHRASVSPPSKPESGLVERGRMRPDERLSCQTQVIGNLAVYIPEASRGGRAVVRKTIGERIIDLEAPPIRKYSMELPLARLAASEGDWERLQELLKDRFDLAWLTIDYFALKTLPVVLRQFNGTVTVTVFDNREVIRLEPGVVPRAFGLAVDLGTTTMAAYLCELGTGEVLASASAINPQVSHGEDIMNRIASCRGPGRLKHMQELVVSGLNTLIKDVALQAEILPEDICEAVIVSNTVMHHILLGIDPQSLGVVPFSPSVCRSIDVKAREIGLEIMAGANIHLPPVEAGFVGSDNVAVILAEAPHMRDELSLIIDIGTNGELVLGNREKLLSASCPTGPALEGANLEFGMRAAPGAIERIRIDPDTLEVRFRVIGNGRWSNRLDAPEIGALGICGSAVIEAVAELLQAGLLESGGRFSTDRICERVRKSVSERYEFVIAWAEQTAIGRDICLTQADVRAVQLAKGALYAGSQVLLRRFGRERPDRVILAGAFGSVIDLKRALAIGMFPDCGLENLSAVGNAAGDGARIALLDSRKRAEANRIARQIEYVELTADANFNQDFVDATIMPHAYDSFPSLEGKGQADTEPLSTVRDSDV